MGMNETMLDVKFPFGPGVNISASPLETFRVYEILNEDDDLDRQGLARRKLLRTVAPQVGMDITPFYSVGGDSASIRAGADAAAEAGFGAIHTQVDPFDTSPAHIAQVKSDVAYVHSKGLAAAFYVLLQNPPGLTAKDEVINPDTGQGEGIACFARNNTDQPLHTARPPHTLTTLALNPGLDGNPNARTGYRLPRRLPRGHRGLRAGHGVRFCRHGWPL